MTRLRMLRNVATNWAVVAWTIIWGIALVPIYLHYLGPTNYGIWILINAVVGYYGLLDLGIRPALMRHVARYIGLQDRQGLNEIFNTAWIIQAVIGLAVIVLTLGLTLLLPLASGFAINEFDHARALILVFGASAALSFLSAALSSAINGAERYDVSNALLLGASLIVNTGHIVALHMGGGLLAMAVIVFLTRLVEIPVTAFAAKAAIPGLRIDFRLCRYSRARELFNYGVHAFAVATGERLRFATDAIVISAFLPAAAVATFNIGNRPMAFLTDGVRSISNVLTPAFSRKEASDSQESLARLLLDSTRVTSIIAVLGCLILAISGDRLLTLWLGPGFDESFKIMLVLIPAYLVETSLSPTGSYLLGTRGYNLISRVIILEGLANVFLSVILVGPLGLTGVAIGTAVPMLVARLLVLPAMATRLAGLSTIDFLRNCWLPLVPTTIIAATVGLVTGRWISGSGLLAVTVHVALIALAYVGFLIMTMKLTHDEMLYKLARLKLRADS